MRNRAGEDTHAHVYTASSADDVVLGWSQDLDLHTARSPQEGLRDNRV